MQAYYSELIHLVICRTNICLDVSLAVMENRESLSAFTPTDRRCICWTGRKSQQFEKKQVIGDIPGLKTLKNAVEKKCRFLVTGFCLL